MNIQQVERELKRVMDDHPLLTIFGIGTDEFGDWAQSRKALADAAPAVAATIEWIEANLRPVRRIHQSDSSYGMKHLVERAIGYITNGVFIAAMLICGYRMVAKPPNALFNVSPSALRKAYDRERVEEVMRPRPAPPPLVNLGR